MKIVVIITLLNFLFSMATQKNLKSTKKIPKSFIIHSLITGVNGKVVREIKNRLQNDIKCIIIYEHIRVSDLLFVRNQVIFFINVLSSLYLFYSTLHQCTKYNNSHYFRLRKTIFKAGFTNDAY